MDSGNWEEEMETNDALPFCSSTSQGKLDFPLLHSVVTGSCYLVIRGQGHQGLDHIAVNKWINEH